MAHPSANVNVMISAAQKAARGLIRDFGEIEHLQTSRKGPADFVSVADQKAERRVREHLERARSGYGFLMEEGGEIAGSDSRHRWIVDPLDGTTNFLHGIPHFAISIALERDGELLCGVVHEPLRDETFWAEKGLGAYVNQERLRVSNRTRLREAVIATGIPHLGLGDWQAYLKQLEAMIPDVAGIRRFGAASLDLAYVAAGRCDGFWEEGLSPWDIAAGIVLLREAGGLVSELDGGSNMLTSGSVLAANSHLHKPLQRLLRGVTQRQAAITT